MFGRFLFAILILTLHKIQNMAKTAQSGSNPAGPSDEEQNAIEAAILERIEAGEIFEDMDDLSPKFRAILKMTADLAAVSEVSVLTWAYTAYRTAPDIGAKIAVCATILDEVGHAYHQGLLAERFGVDMHQRAFEDDIETIWTWPIMEVPLRNYIEFVVMQALLDRAGLHWTKDIELHCSFAPYRRTLRKVNFEEGFHMRHGAFWTEFYWNHSDETREWVQKAVDWLFPFGVMWFGKPDDLRNRPDMLKYRVRGWGNDFMRDKWLQSASAFCDKLGIKIPAKFDQEKNKWVLDMPYPMLYDAENYQWSWEQCTQKEYWSHSRKGGPMRPGAYQRLRREEWGEALW